MVLAVTLFKVVVRHLEEMLQVNNLCVRHNMWLWHMLMCVERLAQQHIDYIFANAKVSVQYYIYNIITALAISNIVQAQLFRLVCNYHYELKRIISLASANIIVSVSEQYH